MSVALHHRVTAAPNMNRVLVWSLIGHLVVLLALSLSVSHRIKISAPAIQVKLIGVPQPKASSKPVVPEKIRTQDSAAPKEPPPEMKNIPPSDATTRFMTEQKPLDAEKKINPIEAKERPPTLDKSPREKKVVKNDLDAKVVKNPEDFLESIDDFLDQTKTAKPTPEAVPQPDKQAGEGPQLQLNMTDAGVNTAIGAAVNRNWTIPPGKDLRGLAVTVQISLSGDGQLTRLQVSQSSGDKSFDDSLIRAIRKSIPLPIPADKMADYADFEMAFGQP